MNGRWLAIEVLLVVAIAGCDWGAPPPVPVAMPAAPPRLTPDDLGEVLREVLGLDDRLPATATLGELGADELDLADLATELVARGYYAVTVEDWVGQGDRDPADWGRLTIEDLAAAVNAQASGLPVAAGAPQQKGRAAGAGKVKAKEGIGLRMWWVVLNDNFVERTDPAQVGRMPPLGAHVVLDGEQAHWFREAAEADRRRSNTLRLPTVTIAAGERYVVPHSGAADGGSDLEGIAVEAKVSDQPRATELRVTLGKSEGRAEAGKPILAAVPAGSSLLVNTSEMVLSSAPPAMSFWERLWNGGAPPAPIVERMHVYLLIRPRLAPEETPHAASALGSPKE